jgi:Transposase DDE domain
VVEDAGGLRLYECFIDGAFAKAKSEAMGSVALESEGVKAMIRFDAKGLPGACSAPTNPAESHLIQQLFAFTILETTPPRVIGDKSYDSYGLDQFLAAQGVEMIGAQSAQPLSNPGRSALGRYKLRWTVERTVAWLQNDRRLCIRWQKSHLAVQGFLHMGCALSLIKEVLG